jgi:Flp pilus assembly protein TadD
MIRTGSAARALPHLAAAAKENPKDGQVHFLLASAYRQTGRKAEAAEEIRLFQTLQVLDTETSTPSGGEDAAGQQQWNPLFNRPLK